MISKRIIVYVSAICLLCPWPLSADLMGEGRVEEWISGLEDVQLGNSPLNPHVAVDYPGREIYVWEDSTYNPTVQAANIVMRIYDKDGTTLVGPVQINVYDISSQRYPRVAVNTDNSFLVVWESLENDPSRTVIRSRAFDADGNATGSEQVVNNVLTGQPGISYLDLAALVGGNYVAVWQSGPAGADTGTSIQGRIIASNGIPAASQFQVSTITSEVEGFSAVAALDDGGFVAAWTYTNVWARRFNSTGVPQTDRFQVNTTTSGNETFVALARHGDGRIAMVWRDGGDTTNPLTLGIRGRIYGPTLSPLGDDFQINSLTEDSQTRPSVADYGENGFFVAWQSVPSVGDDAAPDSIQGRIVTGNNQFGTAQFQVNQWTPKSQASPEVGGRLGRVASAWTSQGTDGFVNLPVIKGRSWNICGIFCDSFE